MARVRAVTMADGTVSIIVPAPGKEPAAAFARTLEANPRLQGRPFVDLDDAALPPTRRFRNCWRAVGGAVEIDLPAARSQRMAEIRVERDRRLVASDGPMLRVQETGTPPEVAAMTRYRQTLRDVPQGINLDSVATAQALADFEPAWPMEPL